MGEGISRVFSFMAETPSNLKYTYIHNMRIWPNKAMYDSVIKCMYHYGYILVTSLIAKLHTLLKKSRARLFRGFINLNR